MHRLLFLIALLPLSTVSRTHAQNQKQELHHLLQQFHASQQFSGVVLVAQHGEVLYEEAIGLANREWDIPHHKEGKFLIGSLSKQFMGSLALVLHEMKILNINEPIAKHIPDLKNERLKQEVSLYHLLTCTSGLGHYNEWEDFLENRDRLPYSQEDLLELLSELELSFEPGSRYQYSSPGYLLAGIVMERACGQTLAQLLEQYIFSKADMQESSLDQQSPILSKRVPAYRYDYSSARYINANYRDPSTSFSAGGVLTTAQDLLKWDRALTKDLILNENSKKLLFQELHSNYAMGWRKALPDWPDSINVQWHGGQITGYRCRMTRLPEDGYCIIVLGNIRDANEADLSLQIMNVLYKNEVIAPRISLLKHLLKMTIEAGKDTAIQSYYELKEKKQEEYTFSNIELLILALELNSEGRSSDALAFLLLNLKEYPDSPYLFNNWIILGNTYRNLSKRGAALDAYQQAKKINPENERVQRLIEELKG